MKKLKVTVTFGLFFALGMVFFSSMANAYIDPSAMTYIVQVIAGIVIAGGAAVAFYFKRIKRKISKNISNTKTEDYEIRENVAFDDDDEFSIKNVKEDELNQ